MREQHASDDRETPDNGTTFRRCGCSEAMRDATGEPVLTKAGKAKRRELGTSCPRLADPDHGRWGYQVELPRVQGQKRRRIRRGGYPSQDAAKDGLVAAWREAVRRRNESTARPLGDILKHWLEHEQGKPRRPQPGGKHTAFRIPVALLLDNERCHPLCLLAMEVDEEGCTCVCEGEFHGALVDAKIRIPLPEDDERRTA
jgi:hypothetical protein